MEIYDPSLSEAELQQRHGSVMNHEIIHALKEMDNKKILRDLLDSNKSNFISTDYML